MNDERLMTTIHSIRQNQRTAPDRRRGAWLRIATLLFLGVATPLQAFIITRTSSPVFYIDTGVTPTLQAMYVAYQINNNSGVAYPDVWAKVDSFTGGSVFLGPTEDGVVHLGRLAPGQTKTAFFYLQASAPTATPQQHTVRIYPTRPPAGELQSQSFTMTVEDTIQANANKVDIVVAGPNPPQLGGIVTVTVQGTSGTIGASRVMAFNPAAYLSWRADAYELLATTISLSGGNSGTHVDTLYLIAASSQDTAYTAIYTYRTVGTTQTPTPVSPISFVSSGNNVKHTRVNDYAQFDPILPADNRMTLGKTANPSETSSNQPITFTLIVTNTGASDTILEDFVDTLPTTPGPPTYVSGSSRFNGTPVLDPFVSGSTLTWIGTFDVPAGTTRSLTFQVNLPAINGTYQNSAAAHVGIEQIDTTIPVGDNVPATATVLLRIPIVSGSVYLDSNRNLLRDAGEPGTGLSLFAKLVPGSAPAGPALRAVTVNPSSGVYAITNVFPGTYLIVIDNHATLSDVTPTLPADWIGTEMPAQIRTNVVVATADVPDQNFGLINGTTLSGRVFLDTGTGGGTANDGIPNGGEIGIAGVTVRLTDSSGATTYDATITDGSGGYSLFIPASLVGGTALKVIETNPGGTLSVGASVGNTAGTYHRAADAISFTLAMGSTFTNVNFGDAPLNTFIPNSQQSGLPGGIVVHAHVFTAGSAGQVTFVASNQPTPVLSGWTPMLYQDANCDGRLDGSDPILVAPIPVVAGQQICILVKETIPLNAPINAVDLVTVTATFDYLGSNPALSANHQVTDRTTVGSPTSAGLTLVKSADKATALPGEVITYTVIYANTSSQPLQSIVLYDSTPAYTTFVSATNGPLAPDLTGVVISAPSVGSVGPVSWSFNGNLAPGHSGTVTFRVELERYKAAS